MKYHESNSWKDYLALMRDRPWAFAGHPSLEIVTDQETVDRFAEETGACPGVAYASPYNLMVVDLVRDLTLGEDGAVEARLHTYERLLPAVARGAVVSVPLWGEHFVLLRQYRHAPRKYVLAFPRGYGEPGLTAEENLVKELREELGVTEVRDVRCLGTVLADSGILGNEVAVFSCQVDEPCLKRHYESIEDLLLLDRTELDETIRQGGIEDGFTLAALALFDRAAAEKK